MGEEEKYIVRGGVCYCQVMAYVCLVMLLSFSLSLSLYAGRGRIVDQLTLVISTDLFCFCLQIRVLM